MAFTKNKPSAKGKKNDPKKKKTAKKSKDNKAQKGKAAPKAKKGGKGGSAKGGGGGKAKANAYDTYVRPAIAEYVGTSLYVFVGILSVQMNGLGPPPAFPFSALSIALGHGLTIALLNAMFSTVSGGHFNPAVTIGVFIGGGVIPVKVVIYFFAQFFGGLTGAGMAWGVIPPKMFTAINGGAHDMAEGVQVMEAIICEMVLSTMLVLTVLMASVDPKTKSNLAPLAHGFAYTVAIMGSIKISGGSMNPVRSFGSAALISVENTQFWSNHYIYWVGPIVASLIAGMFYRLFLASAARRIIQRK